MPNTIYECFLNSVKKYPHRTALMYKQNQKFKKISYAELNQLINNLAHNLFQMGLAKGDKIAIYSYNRAEWAISDLAALKLGLIVVPIYHVLSAYYIHYILQETQAKLIFIENKQLFDNFKTIANDLIALKKIIIYDDTNISTSLTYYKFKDLLKTDNANLSLSINLSEHDLATIVYTSGTTAEPKGAMLTHHNIISNALTAIKLFDINERDVIMSYLPASHMFERTCGYYTMIFSGATIGYAESISTISVDIKKIKPTLLIALPRVLEKAYQTAVDKIMTSSNLTKKIMRMAIKNLNSYTLLRYRNQPIPHTLKIKHLIFDRLIARKFHKLAGGRLRLIVSGGAPLNRKIAYIYQALKFTICEGYGLTETSPVISANTPKDNKIGTVGKPFPNVKVKIGENNEILMQGPNLMLGYFNKEQETKRVIDQDGWFHTGDQGKFDAHGHLIITGRLKELIVTSYGKKIPPIPIEEKLIKTGYIEQALIFGDNRSYIIALIVPNRKLLELYAHQNNIQYDNYTQLLNNTKIIQFMRRLIDDACQNLSQYEKIKDFQLLAENFTIENGLLTPTLKLRRNKIFEKYKVLIDEIYARSKQIQ
ncbi:MAG: long-chain fatty acid--CoA ligase [candidate division WOR-3 bacterium]